MKEQNNLCVWERAVPELISVNQDEQELRSIVWKRTTCPGSVPWLTATHTRGNSCSGTTSISNTRSGFGKGKSKCCEREIERDKSFTMSYAIFCFIQSVFNSTSSLQILFFCMSNLYKHESLHGFVPLQQNNPRQQSSAEILVTCVRIPHWKKEKVSRSNSIRVCVSVCFYRSVWLKIYRCNTCGIPWCRGSWWWEQISCEADNSVVTVNYNNKNKKYI